MNVGYGFVIRKVKKNDNKSLEIVLSKVMREFNVPETGTALADPELKCIFETYNFEKSQYYILEKNNIIYGGAGISKLKDSKGKFGRVLGELFDGDSNINDTLVNEGHAVKYFGGKRD